MADDKRPKWDAGVAQRAGLKAAALAVPHREVLDKRLEPGVIDGLVADNDAFRDAKSSTPAARSDKEGATLTQNQAAQKGADLVILMRTSARLVKPNDKALHKKLGVGKKVDPGKVSSVEGALETILKANVKNATRMRHAGILPEDIERATTYKDALSGADKDQEGKKVFSKGTTSTRDEIQMRVEAAVGKIAGVAGLAFIDNKALAKQFAALIPGKGEKTDEGGEDQGGGGK